MTHIQGRLREVCHCCNPGASSKGSTIYLSKRALVCIGVTVELQTDRCCQHRELDCCCWSPVLVPKRFQTSASCKTGDACLEVQKGAPRPASQTEQE